MSYCLHPQCKDPNNPDEQKACRSCGTKLLLKSRYRALQPLSSGKFNRVFQGIDISSPAKQPVLIKQLFLPEEVLRDSAKRRQAIEIFSQAAQKLHDLKAVVNLQTPIDSSVVGNGLYLVEEKLEGLSLSELMQSQGFLTEDQICKLLNNLLPSLQKLHENSFIHRDIQPNHIIYSLQTGTFTLTNFGIPQLVVEVMKDSIPNSGEYLIGDPAYSSPEQLSGRSTSTNDLYSLGAVCLHAVTGIAPLDLLDNQGKNWHHRDYLVNNSLREPLCQLLEKMASVSILERYSSAKDALNDLNRFTTPGETAASKDNHQKPVSQANALGRFLSSALQKPVTLLSRKR